MVEAQQPPAHGICPLLTTGRAELRATRVTPEAVHVKSAKSKREKHEE